MPLWINVRRGIFENFVVQLERRLLDPLQPLVEIRDLERVDLAHRRIPLLADEDRAADDMLDIVLGRVKVVEMSFTRISSRPDLLRVDHDAERVAVRQLVLADVAPVVNLLVGEEVANDQILPSGS